MNEILSLAPQNVWKHFYSLTQIPRPSGHLEKIQAFLLEFGKQVGVESFQDEAGNIIYRKPATPGYGRPEVCHSSGSHGHGSSERQTYTA